MRYLKPVLALAVDAEELVLGAPPNPGDDEPEPNGSQNTKPTGLLGLDE